jgi:cytoskeletal protein CcmA (bactofilin family)
MNLRLSRVFALGLLSVIALGVFAIPAGAQSIDDVRDKERRIAVGDVLVGENEDIDGIIGAVDGDAIVRGTGRNGVLVISGDAKISGRVIGDVVVFDGNAIVSGAVNGDVVAWSGRATIRDGATVRGDVRSTKSPTIERGAEVGGDVETVDLPGTFSFLGVRILGLFWLAVTISTALLGLLFILLFPRAAQTSARTARANTGKSIGVGILIAIGLPIVGVLALVTVVGFPIGLGLLGALGVIHSIAYVVGALWFGRFMVKEPKSAIGAFFAGWAILRVLALIPGLGVLVWIVVSVIGVGAITISVWRAGRRPLEPPPEKPEPAVPPASDTPPASDASDSSTSWSAEDSSSDDAGASTPATEPAKKAAPAKKASATKATKATKKAT